MLHECEISLTTVKPITCPKCRRGRICDIPKWSGAKVSRRGKPPPDEMSEHLHVKCGVCGTHWLLTIE